MRQIRRRWNVKRLGSENVARIPDVCGAYIILNRGGDVQYVGRSCQLGTRLEQHLKDGTVPDARFFTAYQTDGERSSKTLERRLFRQHLPPYNKQEP
jgi:excinuclease UvrABC nuclease subunit